MTKRSEFNAEEYWDRRLDTHFDLKGVGHWRYSNRYNRFLYRAKERAASRAFIQHGISARDARVMDLGCGTGFWLRWFHDRGASSVSGLDISPAAVRQLSTSLPWATVRLGALSQPWPQEGPFDIITAFDVLYHVVEDAKFRAALGQAAGRLARGGWLVLTDRLQKEPDADATAAHVRFRSLKEYELPLRTGGLTIQGVHGVYRLMNGGLTDARLVRQLPFLRPGSIAVENRLAPLLSWLDGRLATQEKANLRLLVARKVM